MHRFSSTFPPKAVWLCLGLVACAAPDEWPEGGIVLDPCRPTFVVPAPDATVDQRAGIAEALALWRDVGITTFELAQEAPSSDAEAGPQVVPVGFEDAARAFFGLYRPERGDILINRKLEGPRGLAITIAHELGHALGLQHVSGRPSVMNKGTLTIPPGPTEVAEIAKRRGECPGVPSAAPAASE